MRFLIIILLIPFVFAEFDDWIRDGDSVTIGDKNYTVSVSWDSNPIIILESSGARDVIYFNKTLIAGKWIYEFEEFKHKTERKPGEYNLTYTQYDIEHYDYHLVIEDARPKIEINRKLSKSEISYQDELVMQITIKNDGLLSTKITYEDILPAYFRREGPLQKITELDIGVEVQDIRAYDDPTTIKWIGSISKDEEIMFNQTLRLAGKTNIHNLVFENSRAYFNFDGRKDYAESKELSIKQKQPLSIELIYDDRDMYMDGRYDIILKLSNDNSDEIIIKDMNLTIEGSESTSDELQKSNGKFRLATELDADESKNYSIMFVPLSSGNVTVRLHSAYLFKGIKLYDKQTLTLPVLITKPVIRMVLPDSVQTWDLADIRIDIDNSQSNYSFKNFDASIRSSWLDNVFLNYGLIESGDNVSKKTNKEVSWIKQSSIEWSELYLTYKDMNGNQYYERINKTTRLYPLKFEPNIEISIISYNRSVLNGTTTIDLFIEYESKNATSHHSIVLENSDVTTNLSNINGSFMARMKLPAFDRYFNYEISYVLDNRTYYESGRMDLAKAKDNDRKTSTGSTTTNENVLDYFGQGQKTVEIKQVDPGIFIVVGMIVMSAFFIIIISIALSRHKKRSSVEDRIFDHNYQEPTEKPHEPEHQVHIGELESSAPMPTTDLTVLQNYINDSVVKGKSKGDIRDELLKNGWLKDIVEVYLK